MAAPEDGGPAFPTDAVFFSDGSMCQPAWFGMTLRQYFAAKALQGMLACPNQPQSGPDMYARDAYAIADAMIKAGNESTS